MAGGNGARQVACTSRKLTANHRLVPLPDLKTATAPVAGFGNEITQLSSYRRIAQRVQDDQTRRLATAGTATDNEIADWFNNTKRHVRNIKVPRMGQPKHLIFLQENHRAI